MIILGIDPGFSGALAAYNTATGTLTVVDMPMQKNPKGKSELNMHELHAILEPAPGSSVMAVLELVGSMPGQGVSSTFRFGQCFGAIQMAVIAHKIPFHLVTPGKWKAHFKLSRDKGVSRGLASQRFPHSADQFARVKDDGRAEAALIALYGKEVLL